MRGHGRIDCEKEQSPERDARAKRPAHGERQQHQQQSVQRPHGDPRAPLHGMELIMKVDVLLREIAFVSLVIEWANAAQVKARSGDNAPHPELDERRMLRIDAEIRIAHVRDASGDVISLINSEAIQASCYGGTDDSSGHQQEHDEDEGAKADSGRFPRLDRRWRDRSAQRSSGPQMRAKRKWSEPAS